MQSLITIIQQRQLRKHHIINNNIWLTGLFPASYNFWKLFEKDFLQVDCLFC